MVYRALSLNDAGMEAVTPWQTGCFIALGVCFRSCSNGGILRDTQPGHNRKGGYMKKFLETDP